MVKGSTTTPKGAASVWLLISVSAALASCGGGGGGASSTPTASGGTTSQSRLDLPPTISGNPLDAIVYGRTYTFVPTASDPQGDGVSFTIANKPAWATFDSGTGMLEGTPEAADVGSYPDIKISVTDGLYAVAMRSFAISVVSTAAGSIMLSWDPPTQRDDGTPLTDLAGYRLYWGTALGHYPNLASIPNPGVATYVVDELPSGTYYVVATAYDSSGIESGYSNAVAETIP
jgi:putative Ig domain-containing protein